MNIGENNMAKFKEGSTELGMLMHLSDKGVIDNLFDKIKSPKELFFRRD